MPQKPNDGFHISDILDRTGCDRHGVAIQQPCWDVRPDTDPTRFARAVCGARIKSAGFVGEISAPSTQTKKTRK